MKRVILALLVLLVMACSHAPARARGPASPIVKGPWTQHVGTTSAIVRVEVDPPSSVTLEFTGAFSNGPASSADGGSDAGTDAAVDAGAAPTSRTRIVESPVVQALHSIVVSNLEPGTRYPIVVKARGAQRSGALTTAPRDDGDTPFHFLVYGDNRTDDDAHAAVVRAMTTRKADLLVQTGDFVERGGSAAEWQTFFDIEQPLLRERTMISAVGNHELTDGAGVDYVKYFGPTALTTTPSTLSLDELSGTVRWSNARFFLVNGMVDYRSGPTRAWLDKALADADNEPGLVWRIVVVHHGPHSSGPHGDNEHFRDAGIPALLHAHKIDLVVSGHDHIYERGMADGFAYVVSGGGGAPLYRVKKKEPTSRYVESVHHFIDVAVDKDALQINAIRDDGSLIEHCALAKSAPDWSCNATFDAGLAGTSASSLPPDAPDPPSSKSRCGCEVVGASGVSGSVSGRSTNVLSGIGVLVALLALLALARRARTRLGALPVRSP